VGIPCIVFEKKEALHISGERNWNMALHWAAPNLQSLIEPPAWARILSIHVDPNTPIKPVDTLKFLNGETGEEIGRGASLPNCYRLRRGELRDLLSEDINIKFGKKLKEISDNSSMGMVSAVFEDNTTAEGSILIGADGARSTVRHLLLGSKIAELKQLPYVATFVQAKYKREQALFLRSFHPLYLASPHPKGKYAFFCTHEVPDPGEPETWVFYFYISWFISVETQNQQRDVQIDRLREVKELAKDYAEPWRSAFQWLPDDQKCYHSVLNAWDPESARWPTLGGKVTLLGDAAHPMSYRPYPTPYLNIPADLTLTHLSLM
jgi:hypothetical protein